MRERGGGAGHRRDFGVLHCGATRDESGCNGGVALRIVLNPQGLKPVIGKQLMSELKLRPALKIPEEKEAPQLKNVRLRTASEGRPYKCEEEGTHTHKTACGARSESVSFVVGVLGDARGCDPWAGSGKGGAVTPATRTRMMLPKQAEGTGSLAWGSALPSLVRGTAPLVAATISEHATLAETAVTGPAVTSAGRTGRTST